MLGEEIKRNRVWTDLFAMFEVEDTPEVREHFAVLMEALKVYDQRSKVYGQSWRKYGALSNLLNAARKADRLMEVFWRKGKIEVGHKDCDDDAVDLINYTVFFMRLRRKGLMREEG